MFGIFVATSALMVLLMQYAANKYSQVQISTALAGIRITHTKPREKNKNMYYGGLIGIIAGLLLFWNTSKLALAISICAAIGMGATYFVGQLQTQKQKLRKQQEVLVLFENIEVLMRAGLPLQKALMESKDLVVLLRPAIERSMTYWPSTNLILENLRKEIDLPEGDILVSLLTQLSLAGTERHEGIIQRETQRIEDVKAAEEKIRTNQKPYWLVFSRIIPILVIFGLFLGAMFVRMLHIMPMDLFGGMDIF